MNIIFTSATFLVIIALHEVVMSSQEKSLRSIVTKQTTLSNEQLSCISNETELNSNTACLDVVTQLTSLYDCFDVRQCLSTELDLFPVLCRPECGQVLIDAWVTCNAYEDIEDVANLLIAMCASNGDTKCYSNFNELIQYTNNGESCYGALEVTGRCSPECSAGTAAGIQAYGCCVNAAIDYLEETFDLKREVAELFSACDVTRPSRCTNSPLSAPASGSAHHTVAAAVNVGIVTILAAWLLI